MKLTVHTLSAILGTVINPIEVYITNEVELREYLEHLTRYPPAVYQAITVGAQPTAGHMRSKDLKPKLHLLHRFLSSNIVPKGGHIDAVMVKDAFILWCFEEKRQIDVNFIILNEMAEIATTSNIPSLRKRLEHISAPLNRADDCHKFLEPCRVHPLSDGLR